MLFIEKDKRYIIVGGALQEVASISFFFIFFTLRIEKCLLHGKLFKSKIPSTRVSSSFQKGSGGFLIRGIQNNETQKTIPTPKALSQLQLSMFWRKFGGK